MNAITRSISQIFKGAFKAFQTFPASIGFAFAFSVVTMIRIQLDWPAQESYNFLFNCLHWSFALGAIFSLTTITAANSRLNTPKAFWGANVLSIVVVALAFLLLYQFGRAPMDAGIKTALRVSEIAGMRISAAIFVSYIIFIILAGYPKDQSDFASSFLMSHKAFFIALIYGGVIMAGASGVAGAIQALLYRQMSVKVYEYIGTLVGFLAFTIFVGYFPDFRKGIVDKKRENAQKQPRFIEILFENIMIPIVLALTVVLLLWTGKTIVTGMHYSFIQLSGIATSFAVGGIWLHIMVTHNDAWLPKFYKRVYPFAALVILAFEAWALVIQLNKSGLKITEYTFALIWIDALAAAILLLILKAKSHSIIAVLTCVIAVVAVFPVIGYQALPVNSQLSRLENLLISQNMLVDNQLKPAATTPELTVRESITDAVGYLAYAEAAKLPAWFDKGLGRNELFKDTFGFDQTWPEPDDLYATGPVGFMGTSLILPNGPIDISGYHWAIRLQNFEGNVKEQASALISGNKGQYQIDWILDVQTGIPTLRIKLDNQVILERNLKFYVDQLSEIYPPSDRGLVSAELEDMILEIETDDVRVMLIFNNVEINVDMRNDQVNYWINLNMMYFEEK